MSYEAIYQAQWSVETGASPTFTVASKRWDFAGDTLSANETLLRSAGTRGTRVGSIVSTRKSPIAVGGTLSTNPGAAFLGDWLVRAMGGGSSASPEFADVVPEFAMLVNRANAGAGDCYKYLGLKINRLRLSGRAGELVQCDIDVLGKSETAGQTFLGAALLHTAAYRPFANSDCVLSLDPVPEDALLTDWELVIDNGLTARYATGSRNASAIIEGERVVTFTGNAVLSSANVLANWYDAMNAEDGVAGTFTMSALTVSTEFAFAAFQWMKSSPRRAGNEFILPVRAEVRGISANEEFSVTNDLT